MSELSQALGGSAPKHTIVANGKTYPVGLVTQEIKVAYEKALYAKARDAVRDLRSDLDKDDYAAMFQLLADRYSNSEFAIESERGRKALSTPSGSILMLSLLMGVEEMEAIRVFSANPEEVTSVFRTVIQESFPGAKFADEKKPDEVPAEATEAPKG